MSSQPQNFQHELRVDRTSDGRIDDSGGMSHDAPPLGMAEVVDESPDRALNHRSSGEGQEPKCWTHHLAPAWIACCPTLHTQWYSYPCNHLWPLVIENVIIGGNRLDDETGNEQNLSN
ncbi:hypothetical protein RJ641_023170 [Dillenia turbinata]|uniref:Uncharacterized protein n=1 Tax=Dillenia turbinata TaxID=194707 RepID=A0AAN8UGF8_9MAGN